MEYSATVADTLSLVQELGKDECEHFVLVRGDQQVLKVDGNHCCVRLTGVANRFQKGDEFVHNHPVEASLSAQDLMLTAKYGGIIYAITPNGSIYKASVKTSPGFLDEALRFARMKLQVNTFGSFDDVALQHDINLGLHEKGLIDYEFEMVDDDTREPFEISRNELSMLGSAIEFASMFDSRMPVKWQKQNQELLLRLKEEKERRDAAWKEKRSKKGSEHA